MKGFTFMLKDKDVFVETSYVNKTENLASKILTKMLLPDNPDTRKELLYWLQKAECEIKTLGNGKQMYDIHGDNFGGKGSFVDDGKTVIIKL